MRKFVNVLAFAALAVCGTSKAQIVGYDEAPADRSNEVDSLREMVDVLSHQVNEMDKDALYKKIWKDRAKYFYIGYVKQSLESKDGDFKYNSKFGVSLNWGKTYYLHEKPFWDMVKIGLDWTWMDFNYVKYSSLENDYSEDGDYYDYDGDYGYDGDYDGDGEEADLGFGCHQLEYGMQIGPSITVNPIDRLKVSTYFRFQPSASVMVLDDEVYWAFAPFVNFGMSVSWKALSFGVEGRWGSVKYHGISVNEDEENNEDSSWDDEDSDLSVGDVVNSFTERMRPKSFRVYFGFRF